MMVLGGSALKSIAVRSAEVLRLCSSSVSLHLHNQQLRTALGFATVPLRCAHSEVPKPDFGYYRNSSPNAPSDPVTSQDHKMYHYAVVTSAAAAAIGLGTNAVSTVAGFFGPSAASLANSKLEVDLSEIKEGNYSLMKWCGKPVFVIHRTSKQISDSRSVDVSSLRHKETDEERCPNPKWLICVGSCTHLGCVPAMNSGDYGGFYCPCHGSHYDSSGRIRKGPAPLNLPVPGYQFTDESTIVIG